MVLKNDASSRFKIIQFILYLGYFTRVSKLIYSFNLLSARIWNSPSLRTLHECCFIHISSNWEENISPFSAISVELCSRIMQSINPRLYRDAKGGQPGEYFLRQTGTGSTATNQDLFVPNITIKKIIFKFILENCPGLSQSDLKKQKWLVKLC